MVILFTRGPSIYDLSMTGSLICDYAHRLAYLVFAYAVIYTSSQQPDFEPPLRHVKPLRILSTAAYCDLALSPSRRPLGKPITVVITLAILDRLLHRFFI
jgi:hypothetical protein